MVYIFIEDSTSGYDFLQQIIKVINPQLKYIIDTAKGCSNLKFLLNKYQLQITNTDILIIQL